MQRRLSPEHKKSIGLQALSGHNVSHVAQLHQVCRNTVYSQKLRALEAMNDAFREPATDDQVLFNLPVTKDRLRQVVLGILMICKASYRDVQMFLHDVFDTDISIGTIANILNDACQKAAEINMSYRLGAIRQSASDEIYHRNKPHLAVVDTHSRFCASLSREDCRDEETWSIHLLDLVDQGFQPEVNISDLGSGMKSAFKAVLPDTEHRFDHFHLIKACKDLVRYLKNRRDSAITRQLKRLGQMEKAKRKGKGNTLSAKLSQANKAVLEAEALYSQVATLTSWLQYDILQLPGNNPADREALFDFVLAELSAVAGESHRIQALVTSLVNQKKALLAVSHVLNREFQTIASHHSVSVQDVWGVCYVARYDIHSLNYHTKADELASRLGSRFEPIEDEVLGVMATTPRCSSVVENFNSRLRPYLDARKQVTPGSLELIRFYLNHQVFLRSQHDYMRGKTPAEVLTGAPHPNWLEMLGFQRFKKAA